MGILGGWGREAVFPIKQLTEQSRTTVALLASSSVHIYSLNGLVYGTLHPYKDFSQALFAPIRSTVCVLNDSINQSCSFSVSV